MSEVFEPEAKPAKRKRGEGRGGRFFVLDRAQWDKVFKASARNRMNLALTYLVLLAGTGADHRLTKWSTGAIHEYTGMRKDAAREAIAELIAAKIIERAPSWTSAYPHYNILPPKGEIDPIFLPVALVTGLTGSDTSMLFRLRETGDPLALRLLIDLYGNVTTDAPYAVAIPALRGFQDKEPPAELALEMGAHAIWELSPPRVTQAEALERSRYVEKGEDRGAPFWNRIEVLRKVGAIYAEPWLCSSSGADADPIFPLRGEDKVAEFADLAARLLLVGQYDEREWKSEAHPGQLVVLPAHHGPPAILSLTKLRVEPDTSGRRGAYGERVRIVSHWIEQYARLADDARQGNYSNPLRTQPARSVDAERPHQGHQGDQGVSRASNQS